jgi:hypothetical protein
MHSRKKVVGHFLGEIPSRKNLKEWIYLFGKIGRFMVLPQLPCYVARRLPTEYI